MFKSVKNIFLESKDGVDDESLSITEKGKVKVAFTMFLFMEVGSCAQKKIIFLRAIN